MLKLKNIEIHCVLSEKMEKTGTDPSPAVVKLGTIRDSSIMA